MPPSFDSAREMAHLIRYGGESPDTGPRVAPGSTADRWRYACRSGMQIVPEILPLQHGIIRDCCQRLEVPVEAVRAFVYPSSEFQALCLPIDEKTVVIRFSSEIIEGFDEDELAFVTGHEIGHFLLGHSTPPAESAESLGFYSQMRAREISADRIGIVACGRVEPALRAIMKLTSGLSGIGLRFDASRYLHDAMREIKAQSDASAAYSTHPYLPVRARGLLWFHRFAESYYPRFDDPSSREEFHKLDERVREDMFRYVDVAARTFEDEILHDCASWIWLGAAAADGRLTDAEQKAMAERFGPDFVAGACRSFGGMDAIEVQKFICSKLKEGMERLSQVAPNRTRDLEIELGLSEEAFVDGQTDNLVRRLIEAELRSW